MKLFIIYIILDIDNIIYIHRKIYLNSDAWPKWYNILLIYINTNQSGL